MADLEDLKKKTVELLDSGLSTGVLTKSDHSWRLGNLERARTIEDLEVLVEDLLVPTSGGSGGTVARPRVELATVMSRRLFKLTDLGRSSEVATVMGSSVVDLTGLAPGEPLHIEAAVVMGDLTIEVPPGLRVRINVTPVMGHCKIAPSLADPDSHVWITGEVVMGTLRVIPKQLAL